MNGRWKAFKSKNVPQDYDRTYSVAGILSIITANDIQSSSIKKFPFSLFRTLPLRFLRRTIERTL